MAKPCVSVRKTYTLFLDISLVRPKIESCISVSRYRTEGVVEVFKQKLEFSNKKITRKGPLPIKVRCLLAPYFDQVGSDE